ncbi:hypothetical protein AKJ09_01921 [Labilithrix luteola]|uniref:IgGFc-binding protein N-terminal domain-containing protein n=1 Tax=Labilithrix luteola TaxID=1391654 RepID=A0A0K1PP25_9BACT|nr:IgGFc-binding protein [Labilithrix luteola]AKU95257.1 hypothetical protein AKJ09_01921 [Labilithrix luteola]
MIRSSALAGFAFCVVLAAACSKNDSNAFDDSAGTGFGNDASVDAGDCPLQCSLDGRSVIRACSGEVVQTCPPDQACGAGLCQEPCAAAKADRSSNGCEFYLQPPRFTKQFDQACYAAYVVNTSAVAVDVSLELQGKAIDVSRSMYETKPGDATLIPHTGPIAPGESVILFVSDAPPDAKLSGDGGARCPDGVVPATFEDALPPFSGFGNSFHLTTNVPVNLAAIYPYGGAPSFAPSATLLLPVATWGTQHVIMNAWGPISLQIMVDGRGPSTQIVAAEDDTEVSIRPTHDIQDGSGFVGAAAQIPTTYKLNKGQLLQIDQAEELSGSVVTSNKPTSVFGGHECMYIPSTRQACDYALQQLPSFEQWGSEYVGVGYRPRAGDENELMPYRIVAARDETKLDYDPAPPPGAPLTLSAGEVVTFWSATGNAFTVRTQDVDHPIYLAAYMSGGGHVMVGEDVLGNQFFGTGDPEFVNVIPAGQYLNTYSFFADPTYDETSLVIIRAKSRGEFKPVWLECAGGDLPDFKPVGSRGEYEWTRVDLARKAGPGQAFGERGDKVCKNGLQRMHSDGPFTATLWGWAPWASYAYPGGMAQRKLVQTALPPVH